MTSPPAKTLISALLVAISGYAAFSTGGSGTTTSNALLIQAQGSFAVGGAVVDSPGTFDPIRQGAFTPTPDPTGQTLRGDHAYVFYQVPVNARPLPLVFWHGHGQSGKTWETTPDGREGFQNILLRRRFPVYLIDQPRRGRAGRGPQPVTIVATPDEQMWFGVFRLGVWPNLYPNVQFSRDTAALNQFFRQSVPNTGPYDVAVNVAAVSALFDKIGPGVLVTHSQSGTLGWRTAVRNGNIRAVVSYEPGTSWFPQAKRRPWRSGRDSSRRQRSRSRSSCSSRRSRSSSFTATTSPSSPAPIRARSNGDSGEHALPDVGPQQRRDRESPV